MSGLIAFLIRILCGARARWVGCEPGSQQRIYFANHTSHLDAVVLWATLPEISRAKTRPVAARDYWAASRLRLWLAKEVFQALLIERRKVTTEDNPLRDMLDALDGGSSLILFPEGTRSANPEPQKFKSGLFHLAKERPNLEFVPVYLENLNRILPKGELLPVPVLGSVTVGTCVRLEHGETKESFLERARLAVWNLHQT
jgi:1-acyl-sn-glycerol-3-phosphate acyltransferase